MTRVRHLAAAITSLIRGDIEDHVMAGGVLLRYRPPGEADSRHRLLVYRVGAAPTTGELATARQALERALGRPVLPAESWTHGRLTGYLLPWRPAARQEALALDVPAVAHPYGDGA